MNDPLDPAFADYWIRHLLRVEDTIFVLARPFGVPSYDLSLDVATQPRGSFSQFADVC